MTYKNTFKPERTGINTVLLPVGKKANTYAGMDKAIHDFRSSINIIMGYSELMLDEAMGKMTEEQSQSLKDILKNSQHLMDIVNDIALWQPPQRG
jgi:signal transduction histidine kinase